MFELLVFIPSFETDLYNYAIKLISKSTITSTIIDENDSRANLYLAFPFKYPSFIIVKDNLIKDIQHRKMNEVEFVDWLLFSTN